MTASKDTKQKPDFYIYAKNAEGKNERIGAAFKHKKGSGMNLVIGNARYSVFPPIAKPETGESA